jgi:hypothetical protein
LGDAKSANATPDINLEIIESKEVEDKFQSVTTGTDRKRSYNDADVAIQNQTEADHPTKKTPIIDPLNTANNPSITEHTQKAKKISNHKRQKKVPTSSKKVTIKDADESLALNNSLDSKIASIPKDPNTSQKTKDVSKAKKSKDDVSQQKRVLPSKVTTVILKSTIKDPDRVVTTKENTTVSTSKDHGSTNPTTSVKRTRETKLTPQEQLVTPMTPAMSSKVNLDSFRGIQVAKTFQGTVRLGQVDSYNRSFYFCTFEHGKKVRLKEETFHQAVYVYFYTYERSWTGDYIHSQVLIHVLKFVI